MFFSRTPSMIVWPVMTLLVSACSPSLGGLALADDDAVPIADAGAVDSATPREVDVLEEDGLSPIDTGLVVDSGATPDTSPTPVDTATVMDALPEIDTSPTVDAPADTAVSPPVCDAACVGTHTACCYMPDTGVATCTSASAPTVFGRNCFEKSDCSWAQPHCCPEAPPYGCRTSCREDPCAGEVF